MKRFFVLALVLAFVPAPVCAADVTAAQLEAIEADRLTEALSEEARLALDGSEPGLDFDYRDALKKLVTSGKGVMGTAIKQAAGSAGTLMLICVLCSLAEIVAASVGSNKIPSYISLAGVLACSAVALGDADSFIGLGAQMIADVDEFSKVLLPSLSAAAAAGGQFTAAAAKYAAAAMFIDVLVTAADRVLLPLVYCYIAVTVAGAAVGGAAVKSAAALLKWLCKTILTVLMLAFVAYLGITGLMSGTADAVTTRVTKTLLSTTLPVVGGIVADASSAVITGAALVKNAVGVFGLMAVCAVCLGPFLRLGVNYLMYKLAAGLAAMSTDGAVTRLISGVGDAFGLMMAISGSSAVMLFISVISVMKAVGA